MTSPIASDTRLHSACRQPLNIPDPVEAIPAPPRPGCQLPPLRPLPDSRILDLRAGQDLRDACRPRAWQQRLTSFREQSLPGFADLLDRSALPAGPPLLIWIAHEKISVALAARADVDETLSAGGGEAFQSRDRVEHLVCALLGFRPSAELVLVQVEHARDHTPIAGPHPVGRTHHVREEQRRPGED